MKGSKGKSGIFLFLALLLIIPKGFCSSPINATVYLNFGEISPFYTMSVSKDEIVLWSFQTYDTSFNVQAVAIGVGVMLSSGKTSDSGSVEALTTGNIVFYFANLGPDSGYIDIAIRIKEDSIDGYLSLPFMIIPVSIISLILIKRKISLKFLSY